jgi:hypothetical protein
MANAGMVGYDGAAAMITDSPRRAQLMAIARPVSGGSPTSCAQD